MINLSENLRGFSKLFAQNDDFYHAGRAGLF